MKGRLRELDSRNKIIELVKTASIFTLPLFLYNICSLEAFKYSPSIALTNLLSVCTLILTLVFSGLFPSSFSDRFSIWKFFCCLLCINGIGFSCLNDSWYSYSFDDAVQGLNQRAGADSNLRTTSIGESMINSGAEYTSLLDFLLHFKDRPIDEQSRSFFQNWILLG